MRKYKLTEVIDYNISIPGCLTQRAEDKDQFIKSYPHVTHVTDVIRDEILSRMEGKLFPKDESFVSPGWGERHAKDIGYLKAMREVLDLLP